MLEHEKVCMHMYVCCVGVCKIIVRGCACDVRVDVHGVCGVYVYVGMWVCVLGMSVFVCASVCECAHFTSVNVGDRRKRERVPWSGWGEVDK